MTITRTSIAYVKKRHSFQSRFPLSTIYDLTIPANFKAPPTKFDMHVVSENIQCHEMKVYIGVPSKSLKYSVCSNHFLEISFLGLDPDAI